MIQERQSQHFQFDLRKAHQRSSKKEFRIASGATIPNLGRVVLPTVDVESFRRRLKGSVADVGKALLSAAEASKDYDGCVSVRGGNLVPRDGMPGWKMREHIGWLIGKYGKVEWIDLFRDKKPYLKVGKAAIDETQKTLAAFTFGGLSGSGGLAAGTPAPMEAEGTWTDREARQARP